MNEFVRLLVVIGASLVIAWLARGAWQTIRDRARPAARLAIVALWTAAVLGAVGSLFAGFPVGAEGVVLVALSVVISMPSILVWLTGGPRPDFRTVLRELRSEVEAGPHSEGDRARLREAIGGLEGFSANVDPDAIRVAQMELTDLLEDRYPSAEEVAERQMIMDSVHEREERARHMSGRP